MYAGTELNVISGATMKQWLRIVRKRDQMWRSWNAQYVSAHLYVCTMYILCGGVPLCIWE
ncbi:hypothetical protein BDV34DRAFT_196864 [Aspergillus parasiticus]|uniref:Uncharacterized protein n=1 Tax=Aspergillus parasiticus TaxID=5067 RepID=A0A5N6DKQ2_ASPPA|nr:hypothetical protein BDV34DRAFT_196864 [Aspergillus parasiticus]